MGDSQIRRDHAEYKPVNDIIANQRKVSGNGAAEINGMTILVGKLKFNLCDTYGQNLQRLTLWLPSRQILKSDCALFGTESYFHKMLNKPC